MVFENSAILFVEATRLMVFCVALRDACQVGSTSPEELIAMSLLRVRSGLHVHRASIDVDVHSARPVLRDVVPVLVASRLGRMTTIDPDTEHLASEAVIDRHRMNCLV
jgi:hypothetical protein